MSKPSCPQNAQFEFPVERKEKLHPPVEYKLFQRISPFERVTLASGLTAVMITRHEHVRKLLDDPKLSADENIPGYPFLYQGAFASPLKDTFMRRDGEGHLAIRRILAKEFTPEKIKSLEPVVQEIVDRRLGSMEIEGGPIDLVKELAFPVPSETICSVLGVPKSDREVFEANTRAMIDIKSSQRQVMGAMNAIVSYLNDLISEKRERSSDDLLGRLIAAEKAEILSEEEISQIALILLVAGHETTANMIGLGVYTLLENPDQLSKILVDPELWASAIEELLRHQTIVQNPIQRVATEDISIDGNIISKGEGVIMVLETANRDPRTYTDADRLDVTRNARNHLAFSFGPHHCLGHALARMELRLVFQSLFERFPGLQLADPRIEVAMRPTGVGLYGVESLMVSW